MGRRSVWSDPRLIEAARAFVPIADEVWRLQTGDDAECRAFQAMANAGHYKHKGGTRQGIYLCAPSGALLASINSNNPDQVLEMIERGKAAWQALVDEERWLANPRSVQPKQRWEEHYPNGGLVLEQLNRDLADGEERGRWNRDFVWFSKDEARGMLPANPSVDEEFSFPSELSLRLARFHLVDDVRGQTLPFAPQEVEQSDLMGRVESIDGTLISVELHGSTRSDAAGPWLLGDNLFKPRENQQHPHGLAAALLGSATYDTQEERFVAFDLVAVAERWGRTQFNGRWRDSEAGQLGFVFRLAPTETPRRVPPAFVHIYDAPWLQSTPNRSPSEPLQDQ